MFCLVQDHSKALNDQSGDGPWLSLGLAKHQLNQNLVSPKLTQV